jgi:broad specificity phosphatase PhoE
MNSIFLVRHAQSQSNVDNTLLHSITNMKIQLTEIGRRQAKEAGIFLNNHLKDKTICLWNSPFTRTRQTAEIIYNELTDVLNKTKKESVYLVERNFGLVDAQSNYFEHPNNKAFINYYDFHQSSGDTFFAKPPLGESPFEMSMRMHQFYLHHILTEPDVNHIIVSHGASLRGLNLMVKNLPYEKFISANPANASVNLMSEEGLNAIFCPSILSR